MNRERIEELKVLTKISARKNFKAGLKLARIATMEEVREEARAVVFEDRSSEELTDETLAEFVELTGLIQEEASMMAHEQLNAMDAVFFDDPEGLERAVDKIKILAAAAELDAEAAE